MFWILLIFTVIVLIAYIYVLRDKLSFGICRCSKNLVGKVAIVTGSNIGIGFETAKDFAERGANVILACRNEQRGLKARDDIVAATGNKDVHYYNLDLSSLKSVRDFAEKIKHDFKRLDLLINNAGDLDLELRNTDDGLLLGMQVNYFGPFLLTNLLLPLLKASGSSRIVNVASMAYKFGEVTLEDLNKTPKGIFDKMKIYSNAKLCTILMTIELNKRLEHSGVTVNALCPGFVATNIMNKVKSSFFRYLLNLRVLLMSKDCWEGAQTQIYLAVSPEVNNVSGCFFTDCKKRVMEDFANDPVVATKLWDVTEKIVNLQDSKNM